MFVMVTIITSGVRWVDLKSLKHAIILSNKVSNARTGVRSHKRHLNEI